jgi:pimeloyl-ACP methyl ester carboxylesterase
MERLLHLHKDADALTPKGENQPGGLGVLRTIEDDVAAYVTSNEHRERVRMFLRDAASRLIGRTDVEGVIVNGHSTGTVMGFDLIAALSPPSARGVRALITTGSPLRKYSDLLNWGQDAGNMRDMSGSWTNFWDPRDPVADPLGPLSDWKRGEPIPEGGGPGMFVVHDPDTGAESSMAVTDVQVDNVNHSSGGGLRAHNYWDNDQFCSAAAKLIAAIRGAPEVAAG